MHTIATTACCVMAAALPCSAPDWEGPCQTHLGSEQSHARSSHFYEDHTTNFVGDGVDGDNTTVTVKYTSTDDECLPRDACNGRAFRIQVRQSHE